jgi:phosphate transport system protein
MSAHLRIELDKINKKILELGARVEAQVETAVQSVILKDKSLAKRMIDSDVDIDAMEIEIEEDCLKILALHQPVAGDLRFLIAVLKINSDLERIGDLAVNIAERSLSLRRMDQIEHPYDVQAMTKHARSMLKRSLDALVTQDSSMATLVCSDDEILDAMNREMYALIYKKIKEDPQKVEQLVQYLSISRHLERIGDYATNISEDIIYMIEGIIVRHSPDLGEGD